MRCGTCAAGFYPYNGKCAKCPSSEAAIVIIFILLALAACGATWTLSKYRLDLPLICACRFIVVHGPHIVLM